MNFRVFTKIQKLELGIRMSTKIQLWYISEHPTVLIDETFATSADIYDILMRWSSFNKKASKQSHKKV